MSKRLRVAVIFGGRSAEHEVSLVSASSVIKALDRGKYEIVPIGITREGRWIYHPSALEMLKTEEIPPMLMALLQPDTTDAQKLVLKGGEAIDKVSELDGKIDVALPILHGTHGEDGTIQGLFELMGIPYAGADVLGSAIGMDKVVQKLLFRSSGLPVVEFLSFSVSTNPLKNDEDIKRIEERIPFPMFVKPANLGSSIGINKARNRQQLKEAIEHAFRYDIKIIVEQGIENAREIEVAVLGNEFPRASIPGEVVPDSEFYDYESKYVRGKSELKIPAQLPMGLVHHIQEISVRAYRAASCTGMARVDFLLSKEDLYLSEVNTIPGFTAISMYPKLWEASGLSYPELLDELIRLALERHEQKSNLMTRYSNKSDWYRK